MSKARVVLDANVLYGEFVRDLFLSLFAAGLYEVKWTDKITEEWVKHVLANNPKTMTKAKTDRTVQQMNGIPPSALVERYEQYIDRVHTLGGGYDQVLPRRIYDAVVGHNPPLTIDRFPANH